MRTQAIAALLALLAAGAARAGTPVFLGNPVNLVQVGGTPITLGPKTPLLSIPVVLATGQIIPVSQSGSFTVTPGTNSPTEQTQVAISTTLAALKTRADLLATEATLGTRASEATQIAVSTTAAAILARAGLLAEQATAAAISTTTTALLARANMLNAETTQIAVSTTLAAVLARANLLADQTTALATSTNTAAIRAQTDQLAFSAGRLQANVSGSSVTAFQGGAPWLQGALVSTTPFVYATNSTGTARMDKDGDQYVNVHEGNITLSSGTDTAGVLNGRLLVDANAAASANTYSVDAGTVNAPTASTDNGIIFIVNPVGSGKTLSIQNRSLGGYDSAAHALIFRAYLDTVVSSSGTAIGVVKLKNSAPATVALAYKSPTVTSKGNLIDSYATATPGPPVYILDGGGITVEAGHTLMLTSYPDNANRVVDFSIKWTEQ